MDRIRWRAGGWAMSAGRRLRPLMPTIGRWLTLTGGLVLLVCGLLALTKTSCAWRAPAPAPPELPVEPLPGPITTVRVRLADGAEALDVSSPSRGEWFALSSAEGEPAVPDLVAAPGLVAARGPWVLGAAEGMVTIDGERLPASAIMLKCERGLFRLDGELYRGSLIVTVDPEGALTAIEVLSLDDYLRGVVTREMSPRWPMEALKAQAVAARTFAAYRLSPSGHARPFLTQFDLAYGGYSAETLIGDRAVKQTEGRVMEYEGRLFAAYFSSTCGGATSSAAHVWGEGPLRPLDGAQCDWCRDSPHYKWTLSLKAVDLAAALSEFGVNKV
ncbi:MAG: SpoIID/LytB domain-containing protein, partial [Candidatus Brocadiia bacterium]|nr:SpoIID/LytB domain-containing protein [Candidatus Brocadiia bacterium]